MQLGCMIIQSLNGVFWSYFTDALFALGHSNRYKQASTGVTDLTKELAKLTDELETIKQQVYYFYLVPR